MDGDGTFEWLSGQVTGYANWSPGHDVPGICWQMLSPVGSHYKWSGLGATASGDCEASDDSWMNGTIASGGFVCESFAGSDAHEGDEPGECADETDNDGNGQTDCEDAGCVGSPDCDG